MSYPLHAYPKAFVGTKPSQAAGAGVNAVGNGLLLDAGVHSGSLGNSAAPNTLGLGTYGFFNPKTWLSVNAASAEVTSGQPLVMAAASVTPEDKIGPFHGGYA